MERLPHAVVVRRDDQELRQNTNKSGHPTWATGRVRLILEPGVVCEPLPSEATRMALRDGLDVGAEDLATLEALGYVHSDDTEHSAAGTAGARQAATAATARR